MRTSAGAIALALVLGPGLGACSSLGARAHNLRQLHLEDGKVSYWADLVTDGGYILENAFRVDAPLGLEFSFARGDDDPEFIVDPSTECFEILLSLEDFPIENARARALRTEIYTWLLVGDPFVLARERCALELGAIGKLLGVRAPIELDPDAAPITPEVVAPLLTRLVAACRPVLDNGGTAAQRVDLARACAALEALDLDLAAGRRVLRTAAALVGADGAGRPEFEPVRAFSDAIAARMTALALTHAVSDPAPLVQAAALEAWTVATDNGADELLVQGLAEGRTEVLHRIGKLIARYGLPRPYGEHSSEERRQREDKWIFSLVQLATETFEGEVSAAACEALATVSGGALVTLRFEEWGRWWEQRMAARADGEDGA